MPNNNQPNNMRSTTTGKLELRKLWSVPKAEFIYALFVEVKTETCEVDKDGNPNWDKINSTDYSYQTPQGYVGDEEWAKKTAEHFDIDFPAEEFMGDDKEEEDKSAEK